MSENQSFEEIPYFMWKIKNIDSIQKLKSPIFTVADVKFSMLFQQNDGKSAFFLVPEVEDQQSTVPLYTIKASISIMNPDKYFEDFLFIQKTTNINCTDSKERHLVWQLETKSLDNPDMVQRENGEKNVTFLCVFGPLCEYQQNEADIENAWCEFLCMKRLGKDLDQLRLNEDASFVLKCEGKSIPVHEVILSARSGTFADKFRNKNETEKEIEINMNFDVLENIITYIYSGRLKEDKPSVEMLVELYRRAIEYKIESLKNMAYFRLIEILNTPDVSCSKDTSDEEKLPSTPYIMEKKKLSAFSLELLSMADKCKDENFKAEIILSIVQNNDFILKEEEWKVFRSCEENKKLAMEVYDVLVKVV